jgi:hypothetical protein
MIGRTLMTQRRNMYVVYGPAVDLQFTDVGTAMRSGPRNEQPSNGSSHNDLVFSSPLFT